jgi:hypothetical protein
VLSSEIYLYHDFACLASGVKIPTPANLPWLARDYHIPHVAVLSMALRRTVDHPSTDIARFQARETGAMFDLPCDVENHLTGVYPWVDIRLS